MIRAPVGVRDRIGHREHVRQQREPLIERGRRRHDVVERATLDQLHRVERLAGRPLARLVDADDRRVLEPRGQQRLALEPCAQVRAVRAAAP